VSACARVMEWAYGQQIKPSSRKSVFVYLCYRANDELGEAWPSVPLICKHTGYDRDTVIDSLDDLPAQHRIEDTGQRKGLTRSVKVYRIIGYPISSRKNGTAKQSGFSAKQSEFSPKQSDSSLENRQNTQRKGAPLKNLIDAKERKAALEKELEKMRADSRNFLYGVDATKKWKPEVKHRVDAMKERLEECKTFILGV
jgi:pyocin large subunit-like protein